jgi:uncharacterized membrane protein
MASITNVLLLAGTLGPIQRRESPIYLPAGEVAALRWLGAEGSAGEAVLSTYAVGNVIPAWTDLRVYIGHGPETLDYGRKEDSVRVFFQASTEDSWREALLAEHSLDYVFYGPEERALGAWDPSGAGYLATVYAREGYVIYEVVGGEQP